MHKKMTSGTCESVVGSEGPKALNFPQFKQFIEIDSGWVFFFVPFFFLLLFNVSRYEYNVNANEYVLGFDIMMMD